MESTFTNYVMKKVADENKVVRISCIIIIFTRKIKEVIIKEYGELIKNN
jgi:hypothetical protein